MKTMSPAAFGVLVGYVADLVVGDPRRFHPVAGFGSVAQWLEQEWYRDSRRHGVRYAAVLVAAAGTGGWLVDRLLVRTPLAQALFTAAVTWATLGGRSLAREASHMAARLEAGDLASARRDLRNLCGRDSSQLDGKGLARATLESVAENTSDAVVGPLVWAGIAGPAGALAYRAANTLDAMVGYRSTRYRRFGWAAARLDDVLNWLPARLTARLAVALAPLVGGDAGRADEVARRDGRDHPSPNAGRVEAAFAGALDVQLGGGSNTYGQDRPYVSSRPAMGDGPPPGPDDVRRGIRLSLAVGAAAALGAASALAWRERL